MKILVSGGAGYIGSMTCKYLSARGHRVLVFDDLSTGHRQLAKWGDFVRGNLLDGDDIAACLRSFRPDGVLHFASRSLIEESMRRPDLYLADNLIGLVNLARAMVESGLQNLVMSGTCSVYGNAANGYGNAPAGPLTENSQVAPINPYAWSKLLMEQALRAYEQSHGLRWASLRYFNACGADPDGECGEIHAPETHLIPRVFMAAKGQIPRLNVYGDDYPTPDGTCIRDFIHVLDLADAHLRALEYLTTDGPHRVFNLGSGQSLSVLQIIEGARKVCGLEVPTAFGPRRPGDPAALYADSSLAERELGWKPGHSDLETILSTAWNWQRSLG